MKRRKFIVASAAAGAAVMGSSLVQACSPGTREKMPVKPAAEHFELDEITILQLQTDLHSGKYTSEKLVSLYLERIQKIDKDGPYLNSVIELNPDALPIAREMDAERKNGR
jgi:amidase